jgi:diguanylate cyclase (GGDEF)-like protein/PAS domain S-box-containing protein
LKASTSRSLRDSNVLRRFVSHLREGIYLTNAQGEILDANPAFLEMCGVSSLGDLSRLSAVDLFVDPALRVKELEILARHGAVRDFEIQLRRPDGRLRTVLDTCTVMPDPATGETLYLGILVDVTERWRAESELRTSYSLLNAIIEGTSDVIFVKDTEGRYVMCNNRFAEFMGRPVEEILGKFDEQLFAPEEARRYRESDARVLAGGPLVYEDSTTVTGKPQWHLVNKFAYRDAEGRPIGIVGVAADITSRKQAEEQLVHDAFHDALTGLPNRALFMEELRLAVDRRRRRADYAFTVLFLDLDRFKVVNDSLGHMAGDQLLVAIAQRLQQCIRPGDRVARLGGDEFTVLLDDIGDVDDATRVADRIQAELQSAFDLAGTEVFSSASIGIALSSTGYERPEDVLRDADLAMYRAKTLGGARYQVFDLGMHARAKARLELETDLRRAMERQEFRLYYQPILSQVTGQIVSFEALLRWDHPRRGLVLPSDFIGVAEETNLVGPIGRWVLGEACRQVAEWQGALPPGRELGVSVNVSGRQLLSPELLQDVSDAVARAGLAAGQLHLEVTENVIVVDADGAAGILRRLKALGVRILMDDFGTGYSSLSYLHRFPLDALKIDRVFVSRMENPENLELVRTIVTLARNLGLKVIAEGVETSMQWVQLRALECEYVQGHLFSPPVEAAAATTLLFRERAPGPA